jgi:hypothetical protein
MIRYRIVYFYMFVSQYNGAVSEHAPHCSNVAIKTGIPGENPVNSMSTGTITPI